MTGFGAAKGKAAGLSLSIELRSVNNRYLDIGIKLPRGFLFAESFVKNALQEKISRGKIDVFFTLDLDEGDRTRIRVNQKLAQAYCDAVEEIGGMLHLPSGVEALDIARFPDVLTAEKQEVNQEQFCEELRPLLDAAVSDFCRMREREGEKIREDLLKKADRMESLLQAIEEKAPETVSAYQKRLRDKLDEVLSESGILQERILAEAAIYADRIATDEETVRLHSHLSQFRSMLQEGSPIGRKLDFLIQEFNREANTIGSKCQDSEIAYLVVDLKSEIEKVREQVQNIE
ncbi:MAG: YicC family protein [Oscillospiraceae bacterium]|nr:YicC family protein [Oscillospiraceae bacterium]